MSFAESEAGDWRRGWSIVKRLGPSGTQRSMWDRDAAGFGDHGPMGATSASPVSGQSTLSCNGGRN